MISFYLFLIASIVFSYVFDLFYYVPYVEPEKGFTAITDDYILPKVYPNFITEKEGRYILDISAKNFTPSVTFGGEIPLYRKSSTHWISKYDPIVKPIIERVCNMEGYLFENAEDLQVVKYTQKQYYKKHYDTQSNLLDPYHFFDSGGHRAITMILYLTDDFEAGATRFIHLKQDFKPAKYSGILFHSLGKTNKKCHPNSYHAGLPVKTGEKYIANIWIRQNKFISNTFTHNNLIYYSIKSWLEKTI